MLLNSLQYLIFLGLVSLIYYISPKQIRWIWLLAASFFFYALCNVRLLLPLLFVSTISWISGRVFTAPQKQQKTTLGVFIFFEIIPLIYLKYFSFLGEILSPLINLLAISAPQNTLPLLPSIGISFFTFKALSYTIDQYRGKYAAEPNFFKFLLYIAFFPNILSGPIDRAEKTLPQINCAGSFTFDHLQRGFYLILWGFFQKMVVADRIAIFTNAFYNEWQNYIASGFIGILAVSLYAIQLYCDFCGYSNIAIGSAEILGFSMPQNFTHPFFSKSIKEFWGRWHMTLMRWLTDYVYIPLGGSRVNSRRHLFNILMVFFVSGLWHGAGWNFIVWGLLCGSFQVAETILVPYISRIFPKTTNEKSFGLQFFQSVCVFGIFCFEFIFFRSDTIKQAYAVIRGLFHFNPETLFNGKLLSYGLDRTDWELITISIIILILSSWFSRGRELNKAVASQPFLFRWMIILTGAAAILIFGIYGPGFDASRFIYFEF